MGFNITGSEELIDVVSDSELQPIFIKLPFVES